LCVRYPTYLNCVSWLVDRCDKLVLSISISTYDHFVLNRGCSHEHGISFDPRWFGLERYIRGAQGQNGFRVLRRSHSVRPREVSHWFVQASVSRPTVDQNPFGRLADSQWWLAVIRTAERVESYKRSWSDIRTALTTTASALTLQSGRRDIKFPFRRC
jgi:hypothetical protein